MEKKHTKLILLRIFLFALILLNMLTIFSLSAQNADTSSQTAEKLENAVLDTFLPNADENPTDFSVAVQTRLMTFLRKSAHVIEFFTLSALTMLFLLTWKKPILLWATVSFVFCVLYAASDELHQLFIDGRSAKVTDVLIDAAGALGGILVVVLICFLCKKRKRKKIKLTTTRVRLALPFPSPLSVAVASDLHGMGHGEVLNELRTLSPDLILIPGDLTDDEGLANGDDAAYGFLRECAHIAPTFYSPGNHEIACYHRGNPFRHPTPVPLSESIKERIAQTGATLLDNESVRFGDICICGLRSGINKKENFPNQEVLDAFAKEAAPRILLCHHPEYYVPYVKDTGIELTVCGHAHGGQWRFLGRGVYAPGQGLFPKYTAGVVSPGCVISRGIGNHTFSPRIQNAPELILIEINGTAPTAQAE